MSCSYLAIRKISPGSRPRVKAIYRSWAIPWLWTYSGFGHRGAQQRRSSCSERPARTEEKHSFVCKGQGEEEQIGIWARSRELLSFVPPSFAAWLQESSLAATTLSFAIRSLHCEFSALTAEIPICRTAREGNSTHLRVAGSPDRV